MLVYSILCQCYSSTIIPMLYSCIIFHCHIHSKLKYIYNIINTNACNTTSEMQMKWIHSIFQYKKKNRRTKHNQYLAKHIRFSYVQSVTKIIKFKHTFVWNTMSSTFFARYYSTVVYIKLRLLYSTVCGKIVYLRTDYTPQQKKCAQILHTKAADLIKAEVNL